MKKLLLTGAALLGFTGAVFAQGQFYLNSAPSVNTKGICVDTAGNYINQASANTPNVGFEVWELNGTAAGPISAINSAANGVAAYGQLAAQGFKLEGAMNNVTIKYGVIAVGTAFSMADVSPAGSTVTVALAVWNKPTAATWADALAMNTDGSVRAGVLAFTQATANPPAPIGNIGTWTSQDLVMTPVPEPSTFALAGLGAAALLIFRRRK